MKTLIKLLSILLAAMMVFTVTGCGSKKGTTSNTSSVEDEEEWDDEEEWEEEEEEEEDGTTSKKSTSSTRSTASAKKKYPLIEDLGGYEFVIADQNPSPFFSPTPGKNDLDDARAERIKKVEQSYNCKIKSSPMDITMMYETLMPKIAAGQKVADVIYTTFSSAGKFYANNLIEDLGTISTLKLKESYWDQPVMKAINPKKTYYANPTFFMSFRTVECMYFNKKLVKDLKLENPYDLYKNKKWTWDKMLEMADKATADINGDKKMTWDDRWGIAATDPLGAFPSMLYSSSGLKMVTTDSSGKFTYGMDNKEAIAVMDKIKDMVLKNKSVTLETNANMNAWAELFMAGRALFLTYTFDVSDQIYKMNDDYGLMPMPMGPYAKDYSAGISGNCGTFIMPIKNPDKVKAGKILNALAEAGTEEASVMFNMYTGRFLRDDESRQIAKDFQTKYATVDLISFCSQADENIFNGTGKMLQDLVGSESSQASSLVGAYGPKAKTAIEKFWNK